MSYTARTCAKTGEVNLTACLKPPFVDMPLYAERAPHFGNIQFNQFDDPLGMILDGYANWIESGSTTSYFTNLSPPGDMAAGHYTGNKYMHYTLYNDQYRIWQVAHAYADPDDLTAPAFSHTDVGTGGETIGNIERGLSGESLMAGDAISWFEQQGADIRWLSSDGSTLTREQAFPLEGVEEFRDWMDNAFSWLTDESGNVWFLSNMSDTVGFYDAPYKLRLIRFAPTAIGDPYDFEKFELTLSDSALNTRRVAHGGVTMCTTASTFIFEFPDPGESFGQVKHLEISRDGTGYIEYSVTGDTETSDFCDEKSIHLTYKGTGARMLYTQGFGGDVGTYDLTCDSEVITPTNQGHCYTRKRIRQRKPPASGFLIPSGDMNAGSDFLIPSGDQAGGKFKWTEGQN